MGNSESQNDDLIDFLVKNDTIRRRNIERAFRLVDRSDFLPISERKFTRLPSLTSTEPGGPFYPGALRVGAIDIYAKLFDYLDLRKGHSFLHIGTGSGYLSTIAGILLGETGINHGIELYENLVTYSETCIDQWITTPEASSVGWARPELKVCDITDVKFLEAHQNRYDRIFVGFVADDSQLLKRMLGMLNVGGQLVMPRIQGVCRYRRVSKHRTVYDVPGRMTFSPMIRLPKEERISTPTPFESGPRTLTYLARQALRRDIRRHAYNPRVNRQICGSIMVMKGGNTYMDHVQRHQAEQFEELNRRRQLFDPRPIDQLTPADNQLNQRTRNHLDDVMDQYLGRNNNPREQENNEQNIRNTIADHVRRWNETRTDVLQEMLNWREMQGFTAPRAHLDGANLRNTAPATENRAAPAYVLEWTINHDRPRHHRILSSIARPETPNTPRMEIVMIPNINDPSTTGLVERPNGDLSEDEQELSDALEEPQESPSTSTESQVSEDEEPCCSTDPASTTSRRRRIRSPKSESAKKPRKSSSPPLDDYLKEMAVRQNHEQRAIHLRQRRNLEIAGADGVYQRIIDELPLPPTLKDYVRLVQHEVVLK
ncbi:Protein-L-isoaspartate O-methyltransferase domain-containing protein 1 [Caenorhabditis elegans]|uniref:Protein-L-isoaspartate O-methyltransferase domain-containing protein 1 n=1 Tax=Caenorhabditis elegans TaxID=6239 RepID=H1ZUX5_CAEEL|nr:Protein-L-isoaspartate O-methyltransferase domain-containing protein 1 [Caenorhabditis elegans]CCF23404.1 Protein-L-isoaspartate O-methyltransferase domain-containing protein 1 [Caenorhabditis elegans]|eukprot:NP_001248847.1 Uncharacterized protein CELE_R119.5 [Caenorhabditis elegans]